MEALEGHPAPLRPEADLVEMPDSELVALARGGHLVAFSALMRKYNRRVFRAARSVLANDAAAEDSAQNAWLSAFERLASWDPDRGSFGTWLGAIAVNDALGQHRRAASRARTLDAIEAETADTSARPVSLPDGLAHRTEIRRLLESAVDALPDGLRQALVLRDVEELSGAEAAEILGVSELTVRLRLFRARRALRESLEAIVEEGVTGLYSFDGERCDRIVARVREALRVRML